MEITNLFKACVKTIRTRNKAFGLNSDPDKNRILASRASKNEFTVKSREILKNISYLKDFLLENRKAYLNFSGHLSDLPQMSDVERNKIDTGAQSIMSSCSHLIQEFKKEIAKNKDPPQTLEHRLAVLDVLENYLKTVCKIYSEQKAIRVKRTLELKKLSRLELEKPRKLSIGNSPVLQNLKSDSNVKEPVEVKSVTRTPVVAPDTSQDGYSFIEDDHLSQEEMQMYELENAHLLNELNSMTEEVKQVETKVVQIAELQEIFTEKVLQQEVEIDRISNTVVGTSENVKDANEQIRKAIQGNADLRAWILFFLLVMSFSLLFLDWYND
ncbi:syntaxin-18 [Ischnura elegans]|uniref:syntaxin-18 n=1 Tax=Ischnura elegans TaxID=197161 RepID=UPI001ED88AF0|nr:syntaxin-18 [Ischnura elegans]